MSFLFLENSLAIRKLYNYQFEFLYLYIIIALGLSCILLGLSYFISEQKPDMEKNSGYECGFDPFSDARDPFHIRFYLLSILFIIFDIEIVFFFPCILVLDQIQLIGFYSMSVFLIILTIGFVYEWKKKALDWD